MSAPTAMVTPPLVWAELVADQPERSLGFYGSVLGWRGSRDPGHTDFVIHLDQARVAGPICGIRPRTPADPLPDGHGGGEPIPDRWTVRLAPPRPPRAADPLGDQLLRPRSPGPRIGRWAAPSSLCFAELRTSDLEGAQRWLERRLDAVLEPLAGADGPGGPGAGGPGGPGLGEPAAPTLLMRSSVDPSAIVASVVEDPAPDRIGWLPCVQVASVQAATEAALAAGARVARPRAVPAGCVGTAAAEVVDPGGAAFVLVERGPAYGRR